MNKKTTRPLSKSLRFMIAAGSISAFLGGWALLAHSPNPYENAQAAPAQNSQNSSPNTNLPPLPTPRVQTSPNRQVRPQQLPNSQFAPQLQPQLPSDSQSLQPFRQPRLRTGGS